MSEIKKTVFVVTPELEILELEVPEREYRRRKAFLIETDRWLKIACWDKLNMTGYAGFHERSEAQDFIDTIRPYIEQEGEITKEEREKMEGAKEEKFKPFFNPDWESIIPLIEAAMEKNQVLYINMFKEEWKRLEEGGGLGDIKVKIKSGNPDMLILTSSEYPEESHQMVVCRMCGPCGCG